MPLPPPAALLGALPLAFDTGEGAELRQPLGISIVGGLIVSHVTLYTTPVVDLLRDRINLPGSLRGFCKYERKEAVLF